MMAYELSVIKDRKIIEIRFSGKPTSDEIYQSREDALAVCLEQKLNLLLIDQTDAEMPNDPERMVKFVSTHKTVLPDGTRCAIVITPTTMAMPEWVISFCTITQGCPSVPLISRKNRL